MKNQSLLNLKSGLVLVLILLVLLSSCSAVSSTAPRGSESAPASSPSAEGPGENPYDPKPEGTLMIPPSEDAKDARYDKFYYNVEHQEGQRKIENIFRWIDDPSEDEDSSFFVHFSVVCDYYSDCPELIAKTMQEDAYGVKTVNIGRKTVYNVYVWAYGSAGLKELSLDENVEYIEFFGIGYISGEEVEE